MSNYICTYGKYRQYREKEMKEKNVHLATLRGTTVRGPSPSFKARGGGI